MEIKRVFSKNTCLILLAVIFVSMLFYYLQFRTYMKQEQYYTGMVKYYEQYKDTDEPVLNSVRAFYNENSFDVKDNKQAYSLARKQFEKRIEYAERYEADIQGKIDFANTMLSLNLFSDLSVYEKRNLNRNISDLTELIDTEVQVDTSKAFDSIFEYDIAQYMLILMVLITVYRFIKEKKNSLTELMYASYNGRLGLCLRRIMLLFISSMIYSALIYSALLVVGILMFGGLSNLGNPLQCSTGFAVLNFMGSRIEYLVYYVVLSAIMAFVVGTLCWAVINIFVSYQIGITVFFLGLGVQTVTYYIVPNNSIVRAFHYINIYQLINCKKVLCSYENWGYSSFILSVRDTVIALSAVILIIALILNVVYCMKVHPVRSVSKLEKLLGNITDIKRKMLEKMPYCMMELYKSLVLQMSIVFFVIVAVIVFNNRLGGYSDDSGYSVTAQFYDVAENMTLGDELDAIIKNYEDIYNKAVESPYGSSYEMVYKELITEAYTQKSYLQTLKDRGIEGRIIRQNPYEALLGSQAQGNQSLYAMFAMLAVILMCFGIESYDKHCSMDSVINSSYGRGRNKRCKICICLLYALITGVFIYGLNWYDIINSYKVGSLDAPIQSIHIMEKCVLDISIGQYCLYVGVFRIVILMILALAVYCISKRFNYYRSLGLSLGLLIPQIMVLCGVDVFRYVSIGSLLSKTVYVVSGML